MTADLPCASFTTVVALRDAGLEMPEHPTWVWVLNQGQAWFRNPVAAHNHKGDEWLCLPASSEIPGGPHERDDVLYAPTAVELLAWLAEHDDDPDCEWGLTRIVDGWACRCHVDMMCFIQPPGQEVSSPHEAAAAAVLAVLEESE